MTIKLEDLTPGTVVELVAVTVRLVDRDGRVHVDLPDGGMFWVNPGSLARIISRPETDADKIARLEQELAERDARIAELTASKAQPTTPVWSDPIEGPPNIMLPDGSYEFQLSGIDKWAVDAIVPLELLRTHMCRHRILMHQPIQWEGGECPVPGDWRVTVTYPGGTIFGDWPAKDIDWSEPFTLTLTSTGGGNG